MFAPPTPEQRAAILAAVAHASDGIALDAIARAVVPPPDSRRLKEWLDGLADEELVYATGEGRNALYLAVDPDGLLKAYPEPPPVPPATSSAPTSVTTSTPPADSPPAAPAAATPPPANPLQETPTIISAPATTPPAATPNQQPPGIGGAAAAGAGDPALHQTSDPEFPLMLEMAIPTIVTFKFERTRTIAALRSQAAKNQKVGRGMGAYMKYALARLDALTAADVDACGITPAEFAAWKRVFSPPLESPAAPPAANPAIVSPSSALPPRPKRPILGPDIPPDTRTDSAADESPSAVSRRNAPGDDLPFSGGPDLVKVVHAVHGGKLWGYAQVLAKSLLTWRRLPIVVGWAIALRLLFLQDPFPSARLVLSLVPVAGIPWLLYRWGDRARERVGFSLGEAVVVLLLGGWVGLWAARLLIGFTVSLRYSIG